MLKSKKQALTMALLCAVASVGFVTGASAEDSKTDEKTSVRQEFALDTIIVEGDREAFEGGFVSKEGNLGRLGNKNVMEVPFTQTSFTTKTIETFNNPSDQLTNVLINTPSVQNSGYTLYNQFSVRGMGLTGYNTYVNGVPGMFTQSTMPTNFAERIEVVAGPAMGFNGTTVNQAAGGLINMYTKRAGEKDLNRFTQTFSGSSSFGEKVDISRRFGKDKEWGIRINAENVSGKELSGVGEDLTNRDIFINVDHESDRSKSNLFVGYSYSDLKKSSRWFQFLSPDAAAKFSKTGVTELPDAPKSKMNYAYEGQGATLDRWMGVLNHEQKINDNWTAFVNAGASRYDLYNNKTGRASDPYKVLNNKGDFNSVDRDGPLKITNYYAETGVKGEVYTGAIKNNIVLSVDKSWSTKWSGASKSVDKYAGNIYLGRLDNFNPVLGDASVSKSSESQYWGWGIVDTLEHGKAQLMLGLHGQHANVDSFKNGTVSNSVSSSATSPIYGVMYRPVEELSLYASHSESFGGGTAVTNSKYDGNLGAILSPAKTKQNEIGIKYENKGTLTSLSVFDIKKAGNVDEYKDGKLYCLQDGEDEYKGVELSVNGAITPKWNIMGGLMYLDAKRNKTSDSNRDGIGDYDGYRVNGTSKWNGVVSLEYNADEKFSVLGRAVYVGSAKINNESLDVPSHMTYDLGVSYNTKLNSTPVKLTAMCYNVTNKDYWSAQAGTNYLNVSNPRTFMLSAQFDL